MKFCMYVNQITPHLMPLAREMVSLLGTDEVRYVYDRELELERSHLGWDGAREEWVINKRENAEEASRWIENCDVLVCERRELDLWERRAKSGRGMFYTSERWFKPFLAIVPGWVRLLHPGYFRMMFRAVRLFQKYPNLIYLADGPYAMKDFIRLSQLSRGNLLALFKAPKFSFVQRPMSAVDSSDLISRQMRMWGYFVATSACPRQVRESSELERKKVLWVGRFLGWKRVDTIIRAALVTENVELDLYGAGCAEARLRKLAQGCARIRFYPPVPVAGVRELMRNHDVYVLSSDEYEGWGAVVNEALEEGMCVCGTYEAGASRAILPEEYLYHCADWRSLARMLSKNMPPLAIGDWSVKSAAAMLKKVCDEKK